MLQDAASQTFGRGPWPQRINDIGVFEPLTLADISVGLRDDGVTADLTVPLRERERRWWSVTSAGPLEAEPFI